MEDDFPVPVQDELLHQLPGLGKKLLRHPLQVDVYHHGPGIEGRAVPRLSGIHRQQRDAFFPLEPPLDHPENRLFPTGLRRQLIGKRLADLVGETLAARHMQRHFIVLVQNVDGMDEGVVAHGGAHILQKLHVVHQLCGLQTTPLAFGGVVDFRGQHLRAVQILGKNRVHMGEGRMQNLLPFRLRAELQTEKPYCAKDRHNDQYDHGQPFQKPKGQRFCMRFHVR